MRAILQRMQHICEGTRTHEQGHFDDSKRNIKKYALRTMF